MNHSLPPPLQKLIIEYCYYPKKYLKELEYQTVRLRDGINSTDWPDLGYTSYRAENLPDKIWIFVPGNNTARRNLRLIKENRDNILNLGYSESHQSGYYRY